MDYEKKYRDLVEAVKELQEANPHDEGIQKWIEDNISELKESEDERIRKKLIEAVKGDMVVGGTKDKQLAIAWLEKQGEKNTAWSEEDEDNFARVDYACLKVYGGDSYSSDWLRKFLGIHKKWKPSEEMLEALDIAIRSGIQLGSWEEKALRELQKQLKAL